jgi:hypothetical protein
MKKLILLLTVISMISCKQDKIDCSNNIIKNGKHNHIVTGSNITVDGVDSIKVMVIDDKIYITKNK